MSRTRGESRDKPEPQYFYMVEPSPGLGHALRRERLSRIDPATNKALTQRELGAAVALGQNQISAYERGVVKLPDPAALARLDDYFGKERGYFLAAAGWQGGRRRIEAIPPAGSMVVPAVQDRPLLRRLIELATQLDDQRMADLVTTLEWEVGPDAKGSPDAAAAERTFYRDQDPDHHVGAVSS